MTNKDVKMDQETGASVNKISSFQNDEYQSLVSTNESPILTVSPGIQEEQEIINQETTEKITEINKTDISPHVEHEIYHNNMIPDGIDDSEDNYDKFMIRSKINSLLYECGTKPEEYESSLHELKIMLDNVNTSGIPNSEGKHIIEAAHNTSNVQNGQVCSQESIDNLISGAAKLFIQKNKVKVEKLNSSINEIALMTAEVDEQIKTKRKLLEEKLKTSSSIDEANAELRKKIENTKNEIGFVGGRNLESTPSHTESYQETIKNILEEEIDLTKKLMQYQLELEYEKKKHKQLANLFQEIKDHPIKVHKLRKDQEAKISALKRELYEKEKGNSFQLAQAAIDYQEESQRLLFEARKEREEQLFQIKMNQIQNLLKSEKQSHEEKNKFITSLNPKFLNNRSFKDKLRLYNEENKHVILQYENRLRSINNEFSTIEKRIKREHDVKIREADFKTKSEYTILEAEIRSMENSFKFKNDQYLASTEILNEIKSQLLSLKKKIAKSQFSNVEHGTVLSDNVTSGEELKQILIEKDKRENSARGESSRALLDSITSLSYLMVLSGEKEGDWLEESRRCYLLANQICEESGDFIVPLPFSPSYDKPYRETLSWRGANPERRYSSHKIKNRKVESTNVKIEDSRGDEKLSGSWGGKD